MNVNQRHRDMTIGTTSPHETASVVRRGPTRLSIPRASGRGCSSNLSRRTKRSRIASTSTSTRPLPRHRRTVDAAIDKEINRLIEVGAWVATLVDANSDYRAVMHDPEATNSASSSSPRPLTNHWQLALLGRWQRCWRTRFRQHHYAAQLARLGRNCIGSPKSRSSVPVRGSPVRQGGRAPSRLRYCLERFVLGDVHAGRYAQTSGGLA